MASHLTPSPCTALALLPVVLWWGAEAPDPVESFTVVLDVLQELEDTSSSPAGGPQDQLGLLSCHSTLYGLSQDHSHRGGSSTLG